MNNGPLVTRYKTVKEETQTFLEWNDLAEVLIKNMGIDMWDTIQILKDREVEKSAIENFNAIDFIEDGIFAEQIQESGLIKELVNMVLADLDSQGFIKKNKSLDNFTYPECCYVEQVDEKLSPGILNYFKEEN
ncbi:MAG: hypothetical protein MR346_01355 [Clostridium sp.]|nr:hypothetical protein [Clostridium sp.]